MNNAARLRRRLDALAAPPAEAGPPCVTLILPWNGRDARPPGDYRTGDVLLRLVPPAPPASGMAQEAAENDDRTGAEHNPPPPGDDA